MFVVDTFASIAEYFLNKIIYFPTLSAHEKSANVCVSGSYNRFPLLNYK